MEDKLYRWLGSFEKLPSSFQRLLGLGYRVLPRGLKYGARYARFAEELRAARAWTREQVQEYQVQQVRESLLAAKRASFNAERFAVLGLRPEEFASLDELKRYPLLTKEDLQKNRERMVNRDLGASLRLYMTTGGSSGVPVGFYLHKGVSRAKEQAALEEQWGRFGYKRGDRVAMLRGATTEAKEAAAVARHDALRGWLILSSSHLTAERITEYVNALEEYKPAYLHAYPSALLMLMRGMMQAGLKLNFKLKALWCGSEKLSAEERARVEQHFGAPVCHWYGHSERVVLAGNDARCPSVLRPCELYGYMEFDEADEEGWCEVIGTSFHNEVMPLIRYCTGDRARIERQADGSVVILEMAGRGHEFLVGRRGRHVSLTTMNRHDAAYDGVLAVQFAQLERGVVELRYVKGGHWVHGTEQRMLSAVQEKLGEDFAVLAKAVDSVQRTRAGKGKWLASL